MSTTNRHQPVNLLWTGGWDSTYRLCDLLINMRETVQPYYIIDEHRKSTTHEFEAQEKIKKALLTQFPTTKDRLLPSKTYALSNLTIPKEVTVAYKAINNRIGFGTQYEWLAAFCIVEGIDHLEIGFEKLEGSKKNEYLKQFLVLRDSGTLKTYHFNPNYQSRDDYLLFGHFDWPLLDITRQKMVEIATNSDFIDILHLTWFCHTPFNKKPCGMCKPCKDVVRYGFSYRLPTAAKMRYKIRLLIDKVLEPVSS